MRKRVKECEGKWNKVSEATKWHKQEVPQRKAKLPGIILIMQSRIERVMATVLTHRRMPKVAEELELTKISVFKD